MLPVDTPKLPKWPFIAGDVALLGLAWLISSQSSSPLAGLPLIAVLVCVLVGAIIAIVPFIADYARRQDEALDERQRSLEALSRTAAATAEQIGIAASGLHEIASLAQRNLKAAETLTGALEARGPAGVAAMPDLSHLKSAVDKASRAASELTRFENAAQKNFATAAETLARTTAAIELLNAKMAARALAASLPGASAQPFPTPPRGMPAVSVEPFVPTAAVPEAPPIASPVPSAEPVPAPAPAVAEAPATPEKVTAEATPVALEAPPEPVLSTTAEQPLLPTETSTLQEAPAARPKRSRKPRDRKPAEAAPAPVSASESTPETAAQESDVAVEVATEVAVAASEVVERVRTSDGATRLIVVAYIGIGNRLFIRGEGPGLNWETGVPLQFVSIGRWRWETADADAPVRFKLYKNDAIECTSLGEQTIDAGQQEEITALF